MNIFSLLAVLLLNSSAKGNSYIKFEYIGDVDKPIPAVIFFVHAGEIKGIKNAEFVDSFGISNVEFDSLTSLIKSDHELFSKVKDYFYRITIFDGVVNQYFFIKNKRDLANAFKEVMDKLKLARQQAQIKDELEYVLNRI
jgi:hypothetical protein